MFCSRKALFLEVGKKMIFWIILKVINKELYLYHLLRHPATLLMWLNCNLLLSPAATSSSARTRNFLPGKFAEHCREIWESFPVDNTTPNHLKFSIFRNKALWRKGLIFKRIMHSFSYTDWRCIWFRNFNTGIRRQPRTSIQLMNYLPFLMEYYQPLHISWLLYRPF